MDLEDLQMASRPLVKGSYSKYEYEYWIKKKFSCVSNFDEPYDLYKLSECENFIYVPRNVTPPGKKDIQVQGYPCGMKSKVVPRDDEQARVINETKELLDAGENFILRAPTGSGKSIFALDVIAHIDRPTLIIVPKEDLLHQWVERIKEFMDIPENRIGTIQGDVCDYKGKWIVVGMLHSLAKEKRYPAMMYQHFGFVVIDETHRVATDHFGEVMFSFPAKLRLGLSATPKRTDGRDLFIRAHIGPIMVSTDKAPSKFKVLMYESDWECPKVKKVDDYGRKYYAPLDHTAGKCGHVINMVAKHEHTNIRYVKWIKAAYNNDRYVIMFSDRISHLESLMKMCKEAGIPRRDMDYYVGSRKINGKTVKMTKDDKAKAVKKRILMCSYPMMKEGTDLPWFDTCILGTPRADVRQAVGRIIRQHPDKKLPVVFDMSFSSSPVFKGYTKKRRKWYEEVDAEIKLK